MNSAADLESAFQSLCLELDAAFSAGNVEWMLIGGLAVGVWATPRGTRHVDIAVRVESSSTLGRILKELDFEASEAAIAQASHGGVIRAVRRRPGEAPLTLDLLAAGTEFEREAVGRRRRAKLFGGDLWVADPDDLLVYKLIAGRPQDLADIDRLIRVADVPKDEAYVRKWAKAWDVEDRLDRLLLTAKRGYEG